MHASGEAVRLRWMDIDFERHNVTLNEPEKGGTPRIFNISLKLASMLRARAHVAARFGTEGNFTRDVNVTGIFSEVYLAWNFSMGAFWRTLEPGEVAYLPRRMRRYIIVTGGKKKIHVFFRETYAHDCNITLSGSYLFCGARGLATLLLANYFGLLPPLYLPPIVWIFLGVGCPIIFVCGIVIYIKMKDRS